MRAFEFFGGVPEIVVPDNLKSGVTKACRYEPDINPTYEEMAQHYGVAVIPARPQQARDKAKVEAGVQVVERWIWPRCATASSSPCGEAQPGHRGAARPAQRPALPQTRRHAPQPVRSHSTSRPCARCRPTRYQYGDWDTARVNIDYHVEFDRHYYSVPYRLVQEQVEVRATATTVEIFHKGVRVALARTIACRATPPRSTSTGRSRISGICSGRLRGWWNGARHRPAHRRTAGAHPGLQTASGAGLPLLPGHHPARRQVRHAASGSRRARRAIRKPTRTKRGIHSEELDLDGRLHADPPNPPPLDHPNIRGPEVLRTDRSTDGEDSC